MKKIISLIIIVLVAIQLFVAMISESNIEIKNLSNMENKYCEEFYIPENRGVDEPEKLFEVLLKTAKETQTNIFRTNLQDSSVGYKVVKYALLTNKSNYIDYFKLESGSSLSYEDTQSKVVQTYLSTLDENNTNQIGKITSHMYKMDIEVKPFYQQVEYNKGSGLYYVELGDKVSKNEFIQELKSQIEKEFQIPLEENDFYSEGSNIEIPYTDTGLYTIISISFMFLVFTFTLYYLFRESKQIAILKMHGLNINRIIYTLQKNFHITYIATLSIAFLGLLTITRDTVYCLSLIKYCVYFYVFLFVLMIFANFIIIKLSLVNHILKGKKQTRGILVLNYLGKLICLLIILYAGQNIYQYYLEIQTVTTMYQSWKGSEEYGVFYPYYLGEEQTESEQANTSATIRKDLYPMLNSLGAIYMNSKMYENESLKLNSESANLSVIVNPNYLNYYPVYDSKGNKITIAETEQEYVILVPEKYKEKQKEIIKEYESLRKSMKEVDEDEYKVKTPTSVNSQKISIIWIKDGQDIFSFNPNVFQADGNMISDPIIQVITENNSYLSDRDGILGNGGSDPLKVKLNKDSKYTYKLLKESLVKLGLEDNLKHIISINENAQESLKIARANLLLSTEVMLFVLIILVSITVQNLNITFDKYKKEYIVKRLFGCSWIRVYGKHLGINLGILMTCVVAYMLMMGEVPLFYVAEAGVALMSIEFLSTVGCTDKMERSQYTNTLKGA